MTKKILIVGPSWVGDMVMAQALFITLHDQALKSGHPAPVIDVLAPAWSKPLLARMPQVRRAVEMPFKHGELNLAGRYRVGHRLRKERYDQVIVLPNSFKSALAALFVRARVRTGWRGEARGMLLNDLRILDEQALPLMVQRFVALFGSTNEDLQLLTHLGLADVVVKQLGPQRAFDGFFFGRGGCGGHHSLGGRDVEIVCLDAHTT